MSTDRKIKSAIKKELDSRALAPFDEFCASVGIEVKSDTKPRRRIALWQKIVFPVTAAAAVSLCVILPLTLSGGDSDADRSQYGVTYNVGHEITKKVEFADLMRDPDLVLYNTEHEHSHMYAAFLCSEDNERLLLAYLVKGVVYGGQIDGALYAYSFDFLARCYDGYAETYTAALEYYRQSGSVCECDGVEYYYGIIDAADGQSAVICYENGKYDYFIRLRALNIGSTLTETAVEDFIDIAFTGV